MNWTKVILFVLFVALSVSFGETYRILGVFPFNGKSHDVVLNAIAQGLAKRGHQVDVITHFPPRNPPANYTVVVDLNGTVEETVNNFSIDFARSLSGKLTDYIAGEFGNDLCQLLSHDGIQKIVKNPPKDPPYDLVIVHAYGANCFFGIGHVLKVPVVAVSASMEFPWMSYFIGNNDNLAAIPNIYINKYDPRNVWDRLQNIYKYYYNLYRFHTLTDTAQTNAMRQYLDPNIPGIREIERGVALTLVNRHPVISGVKSVTPSLVEVSALHIKENPRISEGLKKWLDDSTDGVIYFSFGSMVLIETLPESTLLEIYQSLSKLPPSMRVLMKVADKTKLPPGLPENVKTLQWIPQQAVLSHKNIRLFVTHGGLMSTQEALYYGVRMIGIPLFCDQWRNIRIFVEKGMAIQLNYDNLTRNSLSWALREILSNKHYRENAMLQSKLFKDNPMKPLDKATFWIEYVIRNGPMALRSPLLDLSWWELTHTDLLALVLGTVILAVLLAYRLTKLQLKLFASKFIKKDKLKNKKKKV